MPRAPDPAAGNAPKPRTQGQLHREYTEKLSHHGRDKLDLDCKLSTDWLDDDQIVTSQYTLKENAPGVVTFSFDEPEDIFGLLAPTRGSQYDGFQGTRFFLISCTTGFQQDSISIWII